MKSKYILILFIFILGFAIPLTAQNELYPDVQFSELTGKKDNIGITAGYSIDGEIKWTKSDGFICEESDIPFSTTTPTRIASISKNFTAVAITPPNLKKQNLDFIPSP